MARKPKAAQTDDAPEKDAPEQFTPCNQCHNTGGCERGGKCEKGFK